MYKNKRQEATQSSFSKLQKSWGFGFSPIKGQDSGQILFYIKWLPSFWNNLVVKIAVGSGFSYALRGNAEINLFNEKGDSTIYHSYQNRDFLGKEQPFVKLIVMCSKDRFYIYIYLYTHICTCVCVYICKIYI